MPRHIFQLIKIVLNELIFNLEFERQNLDLIIIKENSECLSGTNGKCRAKFDLLLPLLVTFRGHDKKPYSSLLLLYSQLERQDTRQM